MTKSEGVEDKSSKKDAYIVVDSEECKGCHVCVEACPPQVIGLSTELNRSGYHPTYYLGSGCTGCGICYYVCPEPGAITVYKEGYSFVPVTA